MILVDTSIWIDHLHAGEPLLVERLGRDQVGCHPLVIEELALGSMKRRDDMLDLLSNLVAFPLLTHREVMHLVDVQRLWGRGLNAADAHLLGSVAMVGGAMLWTRDKRLLAACEALGVPRVKES
jgi:predicted nucleic acid-binding protein